MTYKSKACHQTLSSVCDELVLRLSLCTYVFAICLQFKCLLTCALNFGNEELLLFIILTQHIAYLTSYLTGSIVVSQLLLRIGFADFTSLVTVY
jgi:hypothetical protein